MLTLAAIPIATLTRERAAMAFLIALMQGTLAAVRAGRPVVLGPGELAAFPRRIAGLVSALAHWPRPFGGRPS